MLNLWHKHPFRLLQYVEWVLLGIALLTAFSAVIPHPRHHWVDHPPGWNWAGIGCIAGLGLMSLRLPNKRYLMPQLYIAVGFICSWLAIALISRGERAFPALLLVVVIRGCMLFGWGGRITVAILAYGSYLALQVMGMMKVTVGGIPLGRPLPPILRRLPPEELRRVWFGLAFNSALLYALVLIFVLLLVGALLAEYDSKTKLVKAHRRLQDYALRIENQATLEERNRIAREIHDSVGHYLTAQSIQLENTALFLVKDRTKAANHLDKARHLGQEALTNIRASVASLRSSPKPRSLESGIRQLIADFQANTAIVVYSQIDLNASLTHEVGTSLIRIVQEALTNITKHSHATQVKLQLNHTPQQIRLSIQDNGCGFDPQHNTTGFGLQGMKERAAALQGKITIKSKPNCGCQIDVVIPTPSLNSNLSYSGS